MKKAVVLKREYQNKKDIPVAKTGGGMSFERKEKILKSFLSQNVEKSKL